MKDGKPMLSTLMTGGLGMKVLMLFLLSACMLLIILKFGCNCNDDYTPRVASAESVPFDFDFVPAAPKRFADCDQLFGPDTAASAFRLSPEFHAGFRAFDAEVNKSTVDGHYEGTSFQLLTQFKVLHYFASQPHVRTICETGFNLGHSAFDFLTANRHAVVHSFDIGRHQYTHKMAKFMLNRFSDRLFLHFGDSTQTVPAFARENPKLHCDIMYVDGGHVYPVAMADLLNFAAMADLDAGNIIMFDDYPATTDYSRDIGWAWENIRRWGCVRELLRCSYAKYQLQRGFVLGTVVRRPHLPL